MTEPKPASVYFTNATTLPSGQATDPMDEFVRWDTLSDEALHLVESQPTLLERVDALEALVLELHERVQKMEATPARPCAAAWRAEQVAKLEAEQE